ncbi:glycosyltransferase [Mesorhizobium sp. BR1-1-3]|uniref:glycosyltransferase family 2 protein n=1 Tax=Mesorhizobium sp. BR1-1-3 TaxID=2876651 RepID=UPI001CD0EF15|nr:glycosyltransferase family 2 protein [Mesorhizobium sp. BR1-1-3]MBZ9892224.1 glycosyltransferase [Mesorhizobium sp. BR1-1-3]
MASVDIVIPCFNYAHFLPQCVQSVLIQGVEDVRIVIIDNASTDNSVEVAHRLAARDGRVEVICHQANLGSHASFNEGVDLARADYFMILCADDLLVPGALRLGVALLDRFPEVSFVLGKHMAPWVGNDIPALGAHADGWTLTDGDRLIEMCCRKMKFNLTAHAMLVRTSVQKVVGHYRPTVPLLDDLEMALRLARRGRVAELSVPLAIIREHTANISQVMWQDARRRLQEYETVLDSFFAHEGSTMPNAPTLCRAVRRNLAAAAYWSAISHLIRGRRTAGVDLFKFGRSLDPATMLLPPIRHLFRTDGSLKRARQVILEVLGGTRP